MDYLKILHEDPDLAEKFDSLFDFFIGQVVQVDTLQNH